VIETPQATKTKAVPTVTTVAGFRFISRIVPFQKYLKFHTSLMFMSALGCLFILCRL
jgi:hypothetical protein